MIAGDRIARLRRLADGGDLTEIDSGAIRDALEEVERLRAEVERLRAALASLGRTLGESLRDSAERSRAVREDLVLGDDGREIEEGGCW